LSSIATMTSVTATEEPLYGSILLIATNAVLLPSIVWTIRHTFYSECVVYLFTMVISTIYHFCDTGIYCVDHFLSYNDLQTADFFIAQCSIGFTILFFSFGFITGPAQGPRDSQTNNNNNIYGLDSDQSSNPSTPSASVNSSSRVVCANASKSSDRRETQPPPPPPGLYKLFAVKTGCQTLIGVVAAVGSSYKMNPLYYVTIIGIGVVVLLLRCIFFYLFLRKLTHSFDDNPLRIIPGNTWDIYHNVEVKKVIPRYNIWLIGIGGLLLTAGVLSFVVQENDETRYWLYHSFWHTFGLGSLFIFLLSSTHCYRRRSENPISKALSNYPLFLSLFDFGPFWKTSSEFVDETLYEDSVVTSLLHPTERTRN